MSKYSFKINELDYKIMNKVQERLDNLTKPLGSLGMLEELVKRLSGISSELYPDISKKKVVIMCADNGVVDEGISQSGKDITSIVTKNFTKGITGINVLSNFANAEILIVDIGVENDFNSKKILNRKIAMGTKNITKEPAMSQREVERAIEVGISIMKDLKKEGVGLVATGEMGIGNTTTSSAIASVLIKKPVEEMTGRGAGLTKEGLQRKKEVIKKAILINKPDENNPIDVLRKLGGYDIAGIVGLYIGAAIYRLPILIDGFISVVAALVAIIFEPKVKSFIFATHASAEPGNKIVMDFLGLKPFLHLDMRLGEGTGATLAFNIFDAAVYTYKNMGTFKKAKIKKYIPLK